MIIRITPVLALLLALSIAIIVPAGAAEAPCSLSIASIPEYGMVSIDGNNMGNAPLADIPLACGSHTVRVEKGGYLPYHTSVTLGAGDHRDLIANLGKVPDRGQVTIRSEPRWGTCILTANTVARLPQPLTTCCRAAMKS